MAFGGARDTDWTHIRVDGDRLRAAGYLPAARVLLGAVKQTAAETGLGTLLMRRKLDDGTELVADVRGGVPTVTIRTPAPERPTKPLDVLRGFVSWPSDAAHPDGVDPMRPQAVYSPPGAAPGQRRWTTSMFRAFQSVWSAIKVGKSTFHARNGDDLRPDGVALFGNHRWSDGRGLYVSWFGPESGCVVNGVEPYWMSSVGSPPTVSFPVDLFYSSAVFYGGELLYDARNFTGTGAYSLVGGACVRDQGGRKWLYVAQWTKSFDGLRVVRVPVRSGVQRSGAFKPVVDSTAGAEVMFTAPLPTPFPEYDRPWAHPVRFSRDGSQLVVYVPAGDPYDVGLFTAAQINEWFNPSDTAVDPALAVALRPSDARLVFNTDTGAVTVTTYTTSFASPAAGPIAGDFTDAGLVEVQVEHPAGLADHHPIGGWYVFGTQRLPIAHQAAMSAPGYRRDIVCLAPGDDRYLFLRTELSAQSVGHTASSIEPMRRSWLELWSGDALLFDVDLGTYDGSTFGAGNSLGLTTPVNIPALGVVNQRVFDLTHGAFAAYGFGPFHSATPGGRYNEASLFSPSAVLRPYFQHFRPFGPIPSFMRGLSWTLSPFVRFRRCAESVFNPYPNAGIAVALTFGVDTVPGTLSHPSVAFFTWNRFLPGENRQVSRPIPEGGAHGRLRVFSGKGTLPSMDYRKDDYPLTRALCRLGDATLVSCAWFGRPDESFIALAPGVSPTDLTGLSTSQLRLHPAVALGTTPMFEVT